MGQLVCCLAVRNRHLSEKRSLTQLGKEAERKSRKTKTEERAERKSRKTKTEESADRMNRGRSLDRRINAGYNDSVSCLWDGWDVSGRGGRSCGLPVRTACRKAMGRCRDLWHIGSRQTCCTEHGQNIIGPSAETLPHKGRVERCRQ